VKKRLITIATLALILTASLWGLLNWVGDVSVRLAHYGAF